MEGNSNSSPHFWSPAQKVPSFPAPSPSSGNRPWVLVLLASIFLILFIPSFLSSNFRGFRPSFVRNGWDSLNLALIVFAILCGLLSRDVSSGGGGSSEEMKGPAQPPSPPLQSKEWAAYSPALEQSVYEYNRTSGIRRMRSSSSYPDLRQDFHAGNDWGTVDNWRFNDDIQLYRRQRSYIRELGSLDDPEVKLIQVNSVELTKSLTTSPPETPPASSPPSILEAVDATLQPPSPVPQPARQPPPPPPPPPPVYQEEKMKAYRKRGGAAAKDIATAIALFYNKKKRNKTKKIHDDESLRAASPSTPPPPPPPPPPSSSIFSQIFTQRKGGSKGKRFKTIPAIQYSPPPPPPPPPTFRRSKKENLLFPDPPLPRSLPIQPPLPPPPPSLTSPRPPRRKRNKSPTFLQTYPIAPPSPLPPPPPPPPGDYNDSYGKPAGEGAASPFCPSPDVNNKAEMFIKRFHAGLKLEKQNSIRQKQRRLQEPPDERLQEAGIELEMEQEIMKMMMMGFGELADE